MSKGPRSKCDESSAVRAGGAAKAANNNARPWPRRHSHESPNADGALRSGAPAADVIAAASNPHPSLPKTRAKSPSLAAKAFC